MGAPKKHGLHGTRSYKSWSHMMLRCYRSENKSYKNYGARGILVCPEWHDVTNFVADMGERPIGLSLERVDNSRGYSKDNCIWADLTAQARNRRIVKLSEAKAESIRTAYSAVASERGEKAKLLKLLANEHQVSISAIKSVLFQGYWKSSRQSSSPSSGHP